MMSPYSDNDASHVHDALPVDFVPGAHDVVIGKGKKYFHHSGNVMLRNLVATMLDEYKAALTKPDKTYIITEVVEHIRSLGCFVKRDASSGKWVHAEDLLCREKCSQTFRDHLAKAYRSSNKFKKNKRRVGMHEQDSRVSHDQDGSLLLAQVSMCSSTMPRALSHVSTQIPQSFFEWEMSPLSPKPKVLHRRLSELNDRYLVDAFESFYPIDLQDENPFEPTPLSISSGSIQPPSKKQRKCEDSRWPYFEPQPLLDQFQPLRTSHEAPSFDDIFAPNLDSSDRVRQCGDVNGHDFGLCITAAFAA